MCVVRCGLQSCLGGVVTFSSCLLLVETLCAAVVNHSTDTGDAISDRKPMRNGRFSAGGNKIRQIDGFIWDMWMVVLAVRVMIDECTDGKPFAIKMAEFER